MNYTFGVWIKRRRKALDLTQQELAERVGCSVATIIKIEADERRPSHQIADLLVSHLEIPPDQRKLFIKVARQEKAAEHLNAISNTSTPDLAAKPIQTNLPFPLTSLLGREYEMRAILQQLQNPACRLLTLTGPGGVGKTRLALEIAHQIRKKFDHGACFVSLAGTSTAEFIIPTIAGALGFSFSGAADMKVQLFNFLRGKHILLVLDNLEHLLPGIEVLVELLEFAPYVKLLVTSREQLSLRAEWVFEIHGLPVPSHLDLNKLDSNSAAALFIQRAEQVQMNFTARPDDLPAIAQICRLVDGLPLGLELGAAWIRTMSVTEIAREIEKNMDFLTTMARDVPVRHHSIRAVFDHSWNLLSEEERRVITQLSIFRGSFTGEAALQITKSSLQLFAGLVGKSLLKHEPDARRYELHELLRQYAEEKLAANPQTHAATRQSHAAYYAALMQQSWIDLRNANQLVALAVIEQDIENIRTAWQYSLAEGNSAEVLKFLDSFWVIHDIRGWYHSGIKLFEDAAGQAPPSSEDELSRLVRGKALGFVGLYAGVIGNPERGLALSQEAVAILEPLHQPEALGYALFGAALNCLYKSDFKQLGEIAQSMSQIGREIGDKWMEGFAMNFATAILAQKNRFEEAREKIDRALQIFGKEIGEYLGLTWAALVRGQLALIQEEYMKAKSFYERSLKASQALNYRRTTQQSYDNLGDVALYLGEVEQAEQYFLHSLEISEETGQHREILGTLYDLARVKTAQGKKAHAVELLAVVLHHPLSTLHLFLRTEPVVLRDAAEELRAKLEAELERETYQAAWAQGQTLPLEAVVAGLLR